MGGLCASKNQDLFSIVGIGASAGGLAAFTELLKFLPPDTGMGFVLVLHLDPDHKSLLPEILARNTQMPVVEVQDGLSVEPNHVYIIAPNKKMTLAQGLLRLTPREKTNGMYMPVDALFHSMAEEWGSQSIGIVLSGGDGDGAIGLKAIKAAGGITFAQCAGTAQVSSMPNTAAATGDVDFILSPQAISEELAKIGHHSYLTQPNPAETIVGLSKGEQVLQTIFTLLQTATRIDFTHYKHTTLKRRVLRRMVLYQLERLEDYVKYLQDTPQEVEALFQDFLIHVTSFFRDPEAFQVLKEQVFPSIMLNRAPDDPIRIWVPGCSTGEEVYSIAICLLEFLEARQLLPTIQIFGTDISEPAIEKARLGVYIASQVNKVSLLGLQRFFVKVEGGYEISKSIRQMCIFAKQNLIADPPFSHLDLISCRNLLIYLKPSLQKQVFPLFHYSLKPTGFLLLGTAESTGEFSNLFALVDKKQKIYRKLTEAQSNFSLFKSNYLGQQANDEKINQCASSEIDLQKQADVIVWNKYAPAGVMINSELEIIQFRGETSPYLAPAPGKPSFNLLNMASASLRLELRTALIQVKRLDIPVRKEGIQVTEREQLRQLNLEVIPFNAPPAKERYFLVLFEDVPSAAISQSLDDKRRGNLRRGKQIAIKQELIQLKQELATTKQDLAATKEYLQSIIQEQESTNQEIVTVNEEILSSNEELQSTNEELETAKEEIQSTNEELHTTNEELRSRILESNQVNKDLRNLLSSVNIPIVMIGNDLTIRRFTPMAEKIFNLLPTDLGRPLNHIKPNINVPNLEQLLLEVVDTLVTKQQEVQDYEGYWYDLRISPYKIVENQIDGAVIVLVDIDNLKRSTQQLQESRDYAEAIIETMQQPLLVLDMKLQVLRANQSFYETFQVFPAETEYKSIFKLGNGQWNLPTLRSRLQEVLDENKQIQDFEVEQIFEPIGRKTMLLSVCKVLRTENSQMILIVIQDITERKLLEEQRNQLSSEQSARYLAESANRAKDEFLSIISHELRSPLNSVLGWTTLLRNRRFDAAQTARALETIEGAAKLQAKLIEDILDVSRITTGQIKLNVSSINFALVIEAAIALARPSAEAKNIQIEAVFDPESVRVSGDPDRLQQVIGNLLSNAIKFTPVGGRVTVKLECVGSLAQIQVSDTGQGISAEFLPYVFDRFRQADSSSTRSQGGLGLGLSIVRHLVELHGGAIQAASPGEGQGATFLVQLPLLETRVGWKMREEKIAPPHPLNSSLLNGLRLLVVDDDMGMLELLTAILEEYGSQVTAVTSASLAIAVLTASEEHDVLLSDIGMPNEDGYALIRQVRALSAEAGRKIPAVALTADARVEEHRKSLALGFQRYIAKPVEPAHFVSVIAELAGLIS